MNGRNELVLIDCQQDFCHTKGALYVPGADQDSIRLADFIDRCQRKIDRIHCTLDSHDEVDVAHPIFWVDSSGQHPDPFTIINVDDVKNAVWTPTKGNIRVKWGGQEKTLREHALFYVQQLAANGRYPLCIWPPHCVIGKTIQIPIDDGHGNPVTFNGDPVYQDFCGHALERHVSEALVRWMRSRFKKINYVTKGSNPLTEHYSAVEADVPDPGDPGTQVNAPFINLLQQVAVDGGKVIFAGQALNFCVANTIRGIISQFGNDLVKHMHLLIDCTSPVPGFDNLTQEFQSDFVTAGGHLVKSTDILL